MKDSRVPFSTIGAKLKISTKNVIQRYQRLREKNVLNLSAISLDLRKLGYKAIQDIYIKTENKGTLPDVAAELLRIPNATFCVKYVGGAYDLRVAIVLADFEDVFRIKRQIGEIKNIKTAEFYVGEIPGPWPDDFIASTLI